MPWASALAASSAPAGNPGAAAQASAHAAPGDDERHHHVGVQPRRPGGQVGQQQAVERSEQPARRSTQRRRRERSSAARQRRSRASPRTPGRRRCPGTAKRGPGRSLEAHRGRRRTAVRAGALAMARRSLRLGERRVHARLGSALPCSEGLDARPPDWHRGAMRRAAAMATMAFAGMPIACGASTTAVTSSPVASTAAAPCAGVAHAELVAVARRIYAQGAHGRNEVSAVRRLARSSSLGRAVAARDPRAVRAALAPLLKHQITRIDVTAGARTLARIGSAPAYAPVSGTIRSGGRVVGRYVLAVSEDRAFAGLVHSLTGATVRFARASRAPARRSRPRCSRRGTPRSRSRSRGCRRRCAAPPRPTPA